MVCNPADPRSPVPARSAPWWIPTITDLFLAALLFAAFGRRGGWLSLLADADCGWHIRTGEYILATAKVPAADLFSFSRAGQPWFAWEWLSDVLFAGLHQRWGLPGVVAFSGLVIGLASLGLWCWLLKRGAGIFVALPVTLAVASASTVHYLARPHIFSILLFTVGLWILTEDRARPGYRVWWLVPLTALWANLHGGFVAWPATVLVAAAVDAWQRDWVRTRRYAVLALACGAATVANPYGLRVHAHIFEYLGSSWIANSVQEFQAPQFRAENTMVFGALLVTGLLLVSGALARRDRFEAVLLCLWACAALRSARHIPLYCVAAAPVIAAELARWWANCATEAGRNSLIRVAWRTSQEMACSLGRPTPWAGALAAGVLALSLVPGEVSDFPSTRFPAAAVTRHAALLAPGDRMPRILTTDQWADYLIFRLYPQVRVFFDGRSDFYGPEVGNQYKSLMMLTGDWRRVLDRHQFDIALLPIDWPLRAVLEQDQRWQKVGFDDVSVLFVRRPESSPRTALGLLRRSDTGEEFMRVAILNKGGLTDGD